MVLADIASGELDTADLAFLVAVIVAVVAAVLMIMARSIPAALSVIALALVAFGLLLL